MRIRTVTAGANRAGVDFWFPLVVVLATLVFTAFSISGSSVAQWSRSGSPDSSALVTGEPRTVRSDEWIVTSPLKTGRVRAGFPSVASYGLGNVDLGDSWRPQLPSRALPAALYSPFNLPLVVLPLDQGFALSWWLPFVACLLGVYAWLRVMRVSKGVALAASLLVTWSPIVVWWSGWPAQSIAHAVIPCAFVIGASRIWVRKRWLGVLVAVVAGLSAAGLPWWYQPWGIPTALFAAGVTLLWGLGTATHRRPFVYAGLIAGCVFGLETIGYLLHEKSYYEALANTAYPGDRRELGGGTSFAKLFTSIFPFELAGSHGNDVAAENLSEIAMGWTIALPISVAAVALARRSILRSREAVLLLGTTLLAVVISSWAIVRWPGVFGKLTLLTFSPPARVAPFIGFFGVVTLALLFATPERRERIRDDVGKSGAVVIGLGVAVAVAWAGSEFRTTYLPDLSNRQVYGAALASGVLAALLFTRRWAWALAAATTIAVVSGLLVNPLIHGLGALDHSRAATLIRTVDRHVVKPTNGTWAADNVYAIGLLNGEGVTSLTSYNDPVDKSGWRKLDPTGRYEGVWNRFGYVIFDWRPGLKKPQITAPVDDQVYVIADPCDPRLDRLHLRAIVSSHPLDDSACLRPLRTFRWIGTNLHVYERTPVHRS